MSAGGGVTGDIRYCPCVLNICPQGTECPFGKVTVNPSDEHKMVALDAINKSLPKRVTGIFGACTKECRNFCPARSISSGLVIGRCCGIPEKPTNEIVWRERLRSGTSMFRVEYVAPVSTSPQMLSPFTINGSISNPNPNPFRLHYRVSF